MSHNESIFFSLSLCLLRAVILYPAVQLMIPFKISWRLYLRRRLSAWSESIGIDWFICLCHYACLCTSQHLVCARTSHMLMAVLELSRMVFDKWQAVLQKAAMKWWMKLEFVHNWDLGLPSCQLETHCCQGRQEDTLAGKRRTEKFVNQETRFVGHNWQPRVEQNQILYTIYSL